MASTRDLLLGCQLMLYEWSIPGLMEKNMPIAYEQCIHLIAECLRRFVTENRAYSQYGLVTDDVCNLAERRGFALDRFDPDRIEQYVRQYLWRLIAQGVIVPGKDRMQSDWPWFQITEYGKSVINAIDSQPYDPDSYMREFDQRNPSADRVIREYVAEALRNFNHNCLKSAAVMLGAASEGAILLLHEAFENSISNGEEKTKFEKAYRGKQSIYSKYEVLRDRLDKMIASKKLNHPLSEYVNSELRGAFELIRRERNSAGHPEALSDITKESLFLNLRVMSEYVRRTHELTSYFLNNATEW